MTKFETGNIAGLKNKDEVELVEMGQKSQVAERGERILSTHEKEKEEWGVYKVFRRKGEDIVFAEAYKIISLTEDLPLGEELEEDFIEALQREGYEDFELEEHDDTILQMPYIQVFGKLLEDNYSDRREDDSSVIVSPYRNLEVMKKDIGEENVQALHSHYEDRGIHVGDLDRGYDEG